MTIPPSRSAPRENEPPAGFSAQLLCSLWRTASQERGWRHPDDWWTPAVDAVAEAVVGDGDIVERCRVLGRLRARAGISMQETIDDTMVMAGLVHALQKHPTHLVDARSVEVDMVDLVKAVAIGWSEEPPCLQPAGEPDRALPDATYLSVRLGEVSAATESRGVGMDQEYALVVASFRGPVAAVPRSTAGMWEHSSRLAALADDLRAIFGAGETIVQAGERAMIALARRTAALPTQVSALRELVERRRSTGGAAARPAVEIWVEGLPRSLRQARALVADLRR
ncbi:hypothetical protein [Cumulibacter manganitolerans]|uniref:hypothetical protein n=1 Tax=Cumulibacter manganitolerans TaxID=1884992 RepID=UPI0012971783|nr:hypothetical protein [Cumulibacter manganitolerans]